jgi:hypothetical protein
VGTSGAAAMCHVWTFCSPGGSCALPGDVPNPPQWTVMTAGDCVLLSAWYLPTGQDVSPATGARTAGRTWNPWHTGPVRSPACCSLTSCLTGQGHSHVLGAVQSMG